MSVAASSKLQALRLPLPRRLFPLLHLPQTMSGLVIAACLLAATPLLLTTIVYGALLEKLTQQGESLIDEGLRVERLGAELRRNLDELERGGLHYLALEDAELLPIVERRRGAAEATLRELKDSGLPETTAPHIARLDSGLREVAALWNGGIRDRPALTRSMRLTHELGTEVDGLVIRWREVLDARLMKLRADSRKARQFNPLAILALIVVTTLLAYFSSRSVARPVRHLHRAMGALGASDYNSAIKIVYPREMAVLGEKLDWLRCRLQRLEQDKERFLRHISHELKTPLASMREGIDLLSDGTLGPLTPRQGEVAGIIAEASRDLDTQINNLLAYTRWRYERNGEVARWFDVKPMIESVLAAHRLTARRRDLRFAVHAAGVQQLYGQRHRLRVALDNLISNAVKHAPAKSVIEIAVSAGSRHCGLSVRDFGKGVRVEDRDRILEPFVRGSDDEESSVRGTGIGLSIVHEAVRAHGGELEIQDAHPGARFVLSWPAPGSA